MKKHLLKTFFHLMFNRAFCAVVMLVFSFAYLYADENANLSYMWENNQEEGGCIKYIDGELSNPIGYSLNKFIQNPYTVIWLRTPNVENDKIQIDLNNKIELNDTITITAFRWAQKSNSDANLILSFENDGEYIVPSRFPNLYYDVNQGIEYDSEPGTIQIVVSEDKQDIIDSRTIRLKLSDNSNSPIMITKIKIAHEILVPRIIEGSVSPSPEISRECFNYNDEISFNTNFDTECSSFYITFYDKQNPSKVLDRGRAEFKDNRWSFFFNENVDLYLGHTYIAQCQARTNTGEELYEPLMIEYKGAKEVPYANVGFTQTPSQTYTISSLDENKVALDFDAKVFVSDVKISVDGGEYKSLYAYTAENDENTHLQITIPDDNLKLCKNGFTLRIYAKDENDVIIGDSEKGQGYIEANFSCSIPRDFDVNPASGLLTGISELIFSSVDGITLAKNDSQLELIYGTTKLEGTLQQENSNTVKFVLNEECVDFGTYKMDIPASFFNIGDGYLSVAKSLEYFVNSPVTLVSQEPAANKEISSTVEDKVTVTYSGEVKVEKVVLVTEDGSEQDLTTFTMTNDNKTCELTIPEEVLETCKRGFSVRLFAKDNEKNRTIGDSSTKLPYVEVRFLCSIPRDFTVNPADGNEASKISEIIFSSDEGIKLTTEGSKLDVDNGTNKYTGTFTQVDDKTLKLVFAEAVTAVGTYTLKVPASFFTIGYGYKSVLKSLTYTVKGEYRTSITPDPNEPQEMLSKFTVTLLEETIYGAMARQYDQVYPYVIDLKTNKQVAKALEPQPIQARPNDDVYYTYIITLNEPIYKAGKYKLVFPQSCFYVGPVDAPYESPEFSYIYEVKESDKAFGRISFSAEGYNPVAITETQEVKQLGGNSDVDVVVSFDDSEYVKIIRPYNPIIIYDSNGEEVTTAEASLGLTVNIRFKLEEAITENGLYSMVIPAGLFQVKLPGSGNKAQVYDEDMTLKFKVNRYYNSIESVLGEAEHVVVYNLQGIKVASGSRVEATHGLKGLYIVNGKKIMLK